MQIVQVPVSDLKEADYNPRKMTEKQVEDLTASIREFGFAEPIVVNKNPDRMNVVVGGHQRLKIARMLGFSEVPVVYVDLPIEAERRLNLRLNRNNGEWDWDLLANHFDTDTLVDVGFDRVELNVFPEEKEETPPPIRPGDTFSLGFHRISVGEGDGMGEIARFLGRWKRKVGYDPIRESDGAPWSSIKA